MLCHILLFVIVLLTVLPLCTSSQAGKSSSKKRSLVIHTRVGVRNTKLALESLRFPHCIPLLYGNSIIGYRRRGEDFDILHSETKLTQIAPVDPRTHDKNAVGYVMKESTENVFPVPMDNTTVLVRIRPSSSSSAWLHIWIVCRGLSITKDKVKQEVFVKSLIKEFADNARRVLGTAHCRAWPTVSGLCNHPTDPMFGTSIVPVIHPNGNDRPSTANMLAMNPNVRQISNDMVKATESVPAPFDTNMLFVAFGQFLDHDLTLTPVDHVSEHSKAPINDPVTGLQMGFLRAATLNYPYSRCCEAPYANDEVWKGLPFNLITSFIDGGTVYGSNHLRANVLRAFKEGKVDMRRVQNEMYLPFNHPKHLLFKLHNEPSSSDDSLFVAGDERANENIFLTTVHTLFAREHNRVCQLLKDWLKSQGGRGERLLKDEWLYNMARTIVTAEIQSVVYNDFLPQTLGKDALPPYKGYNPSVDPRISTFHFGFAYRWGHSAVWENYIFRERSGNRRSHQLKHLFFNTKLFLRFGVDVILDTLMGTPASDVDERVIDSLRDFLFNPQGKHVLDLASLNMNRMRDLGIPGYLEIQKRLRTGAGLDNIRPSLQEKLIKTYGEADKIDPFVGGLSETKKNGSLLGPLFWEINRDQFLRLRDGDRFFYKNLQWPSIIKRMPLIQQIRSDQWMMKDVLIANSELKDSNFKQGVSVFRTNSRV